jgi:hypothetical protein
VTRTKLRNAILKLDIGKTVDGLMMIDAGEQSGESTLPVNDFTSKISVISKLVRRRFIFPQRNLNRLTFEPCQDGSDIKQMAVPSLHLALGRPRKPTPEPPPAIDSVEALTSSMT